jgi:hypothetical protein
MRLSVLTLAAGLCLLPAAASFAAKPAAKPAAAAPAAGPINEAKLKDLEAKLAKKPADAKLKSAAADGNYQVGHAMMIDDNLPPRVKYPGALKHFRRALELNPKHAKAAEEKKQIEDVYKQMGREVPK